MMARVSASMLGTCAAAALALAGCSGCSKQSDLNQASANRSAIANQSAPAIPSVPGPNNQDWTLQVAETPDGGYRMGNPDAQIKLVEYASISCPHCAEFSNEGSQALRDRYVRTGQVSWEYRPTILFPTDPGIFLLMRCNGAQPFFRTTDQLYTTQRDWMTKIQAQAEQLNGLPVQQRLSAIARAGELDAFFRQRGMPSARVDSCLADQEGLRALVEKSQTLMERDNVTGTPTFFINGEKQEGVGFWNDPQRPEMSLEPKLRAALG